MITNKLNLPKPLVDAVSNDPYSKGDADFSATEVIAPPYQKRLQKENADKIDVDASDRIWSLFGQAVHHILDRSGDPRYVTERRYYANFNIDGRVVRIGAQIDVLDQEARALSDYKCTSVYKFKLDANGMQEIPPEYEQQLNIQAFCIYTDTGVQIQKAEIIGILRDWRPSEFQREQGYPPFKIGRMEIPLWPLKEQARFIEERIRLHLAASPEPCTASERWDKPEKWALMKEGQKRATRLYDNPEPAMAAAVIMTEEGKGKYTVTHRPGARTRCAGYCDAAPVCPHYQEYLKTQIA